MHDIKRSSNIILYIVKILLIAANTGLFAVAWYFHYEKNIIFPTYWAFNLVMLVLFAVLYGTLGKLYGAFNLSISRVSELVYSSVIALLITDGIIFCTIWAISGHFPNPLPGLATLVLQCFVSLLWAKPANKLNNKLFPAARTVIIFDNHEAYRNGMEIIEKIPWRFNLAGEIPATLKESEIYDGIIKVQADAVMLCGVTSTLRNDILKWCIYNGIKVYLRPNIGDFMVYNAPVLQMNNLPVMLCHRAAPSLGYRFIKRFFDILLSLVILIVTSPIMLVVAIIIKCYDHGPVFYKQERLTKDGKRFNIVKFRSMRQDAEKDGVARLASSDDDRITPVGKVIRALRIDELPQMFMILNGNMSICGPRPERPEIAKQYEEEMPEFALRLQVKAGLTGWAQVYGKYNTEPYDKLQMDLMYISHQGIITDLKIFLTTIKIVFMPESTEGVSEGQVTASVQKDTAKEEVTKA